MGAPPDSLDRGAAFYAECVRARSPDRPVSEEDMVLFGRIERLAASPRGIRALATLNNAIDVTSIMGAIRKRENLCARL